MGEQRINRIAADDMPVPERELTSDEAKKVRGGDGAEMAAKLSGTYLGGSPTSTPTTTQTDPKLTSGGYYAPVYTPPPTSSPTTSSTTSGPTAAQIQEMNSKKQAGL
jgi:hypothetical protein